MGINFLPSMAPFAPVMALKYWCQVALPSVYDDSLSYYELLSKVVKHLNTLAENSETNNKNVLALYDSFLKLQEYVNSELDEITTFGNGDAYGSKNNMKCAAQFLSVGESYYQNRYTGTTPTFSYGTHHTALDEEYDGGNEIDCSSFVGLMLRGIPYEKSPYYTVNSDDTGTIVDGDDDSGSGDNSGDGDGTSIIGPAANTRDYSWATNPSYFKLANIPGGQPKYVRTAAQLGELFSKLGRAIPLTKGFVNVEPGDIIFWAKTNADGSYRQPNRFMHISHVAVCYSKMNPPGDFTYGSQVGVTITSFNPETAKTYLEGIYGVSNHKYSVTYTDNAWHISVDGSTHTPVSLSDLGIALTMGDGDVHSFVITQYYWDRTLYPFKHTMLEVTTISPFVLNRTLEKIRPTEVVLVVRPDLGAVASDDFVGNINTEFGITDLRDWWREGIYYLTSNITAGLPVGVSNGTGYTCFNFTSLRKHGMPYSIFQIIVDARNPVEYWMRSQYCYQNEPSRDNWSVFHKYRAYESEIPTP